MTTSPREALATIFARLARRRAALRALAALLGMGAFAAAQGDPVSGRKGHHHHHHRRQRHNPRKRLRHQCTKMCKRVQRDCLYVCQNLGNPDEICNPQCTIARQSCRQGCS